MRALPCALVGLILLGGSRPAFAGGPGLVLPTTIAAGAATADWVSTYYALTHATVREVNPVLRPLDHRPAKMVLLGGAIDVATVWAWNQRMGSARPGVAVSGLVAMAAFRTVLAIHNVRNARRYAHRPAPEPLVRAPLATPTPAPGAPSSTRRSDP